MRWFDVIHTHALRLDLDGFMRDTHDLHVCHFRITSGIGRREHFTRHRAKKLENIDGPQFRGLT